MTWSGSIAARLGLVCVCALTACDETLFPFDADTSPSSTPFCTGTASNACGALAPPCTSVAGCVEIGTCSGFVAFCSDLTVDTSCRAAGCTWVDGEPGSCIGAAVPCSSNASREACIATGACTFVSSGVCAGTATCDGTGPSQCLAIPGCSLTCLPPLVLCNGSCLTQRESATVDCTTVF